MLEFRTGDNLCLIRVHVNNIWISSFLLTMYCLASSLYSKSEINKYKFTLCVSHFEFGIVCHFMYVFVISFIWYILCITL